jgi:hypothetical protein
MGHINSVLMALSRCPNPTVFQKTLALNDFYFGSPEWQHPMGHISFVGKLDGVTLSAGAPKIAPGWTLDLMGKHSLDFWLTSEDLPDPENRVSLDRDGRIVLAYRPNNEEGHKRLTKRLEGLMQQQSRCAYHESADLTGQIESYKERFGHYPASVQADAIYRTRENRQYCDEKGLRLSGKPLGRPGKQTEENREALQAQRKQRREDEKDRIPVEGKFGNLKRKGTLERIMAKLAHTSESVIHVGLIVLNLDQWLRAVLFWLQPTGWSSLMLFLGACQRHPAGKKPLWSRLHPPITPKPIL